MREIKFRAWLKGVFDEGGDMVYFDLFSTDGDYIIKEGRSVRECDAVMQYTGLRDVDGKEIYEGDILEYFSGLVAKGSNPIIRQVVKWEQYRYSIDNYKNSSVVGNVHEHPELLEGSQC